MILKYVNMLLSEMDNWLLHGTEQPVCNRNHLDLNTLSITDRCPITPDVIDNPRLLMFDSIVILEK